MAPRTQAEVLLHNNCKEKDNDNHPFSICRGSLHYDEREIRFSVGGLGTATLGTSNDGTGTTIRRSCCLSPAGYHQHMLLENISAEK